MPKQISRQAEYNRSRKSLWKQLKSKMITWDEYHKRRAKLDKEFSDVVG